MPHRYVLKDDYWKMRISHPYSMLCASESLAVTCGQAPIGEYGDVLYPGDLGKQTEQVILTANRILIDGNLIRDDLERIVVFTSEYDRSKVDACLNQFQQTSASNTTVFPVLLPPLFYEDLLLEVDYYAVPNRQQQQQHRIKTFALSQSIDPTEERFSNTLSEVIKTAIEAKLLNQRLQWQDVVKMSFYAPNKHTSFWESLAATRMDWSADCIAAMADMVCEPGHIDSKMVVDVTCSNSPNWGKPRTAGKTLERGHPEAVRVGPMLFTSSLFSPSSKSTHAQSVTEEVNMIMQRHKELLAEQGLSFKDVLKATTFYDGAGSEQALHENMSARNAYYEVPGPGSTGLPVSAFPYPEKHTSIELIAVDQTGNQNYN
jgi:enamine deaminase RidA (YjgF/YER057c/UK114 family)